MQRIRTRAFSLIELLVVVGVIALLAAFAVPRFAGHIRQTNATRLAYDAKLLENASEQYYLTNGDWPRLTDTPFTADEVAAFADKVYASTGKVIALDPAGNYYDIDMQKLSKYVTLNESPKNFVLQNPVGSIYYLDATTNKRLTAPVAVITVSPSSPTTADTVVFSADDSIVTGELLEAKWILDGNPEQTAAPNGILAAGQHTVSLSIRDQNGWSDWVSTDFTVTSIPKPQAAITITPTSPATIDTVTFTTAGSIFTDNILAEEWQIDGGTVQSTPPNGKFTQGTHMVALRIKDVGGWSDWVTASFDVSEFVFTTQTTAYTYGSDGHYSYNRNITWSPTGHELDVRLTASGFYYKRTYQDASGTHTYYIDTTGTATVFDSKGRTLLTHEFYGREAQDWDFTLPANASRIGISIYVDEHVTSWIPSGSLTLR